MSQLTPGQHLVLESPNTTCAACRVSWPDPELDADELADLRALLIADRRISFVHRLQELTGLGLANAKRILDHADFHVDHCAHCDAPLTDGFLVTCATCGGVTYRWLGDLDVTAPGGVWRAQVRVVNDTVTARWQAPLPDEVIVLGDVVQVVVENVPVEGAPWCPHWYLRHRDGWTLHFNSNFAGAAEVSRQLEARLGFVLPALETIAGPGGSGTTVWSAR